jgi:hypothetical protein
MFSMVRLSFKRQASVSNSLFHDKLHVIWIVSIFEANCALPFMDPEGPLPSSQEIVTGSYSEPDVSNPHP